MGGAPAPWDARAREAPPDQPMPPAPYSTVSPTQDSVPARGRRTRLPVGRQVAGETPRLPVGRQGTPWEAPTLPGARNVPHHTGAIGEGVVVLAARAE